MEKWFSIRQNPVLQSCAFQQCQHYLFVCPRNTVFFQLHFFPLKSSHVFVQPFSQKQDNILWYFCGRKVCYKQLLVIKCVSVTVCILFFHYVAQFFQLIWIKTSLTAFPSTNAIFFYLSQLVDKCHKRIKSCQFFLKKNMFYYIQMQNTEYLYRRRVLI